MHSPNVAPHAIAQHVFNAVRVLNRVLYHAVILYSAFEVELAELFSDGHFAHTVTPFIVTG